MDYLIQQGRYSLKKKYVVSVSACGPDMDPTGERDCTEALQEAIDRCADAGGGTVYLPEGSYMLKNQLVIRTAVTLLGDFVDPEEERAKGRGTILCCAYYNEEGSPQILMKACSGLIGVTCYYPKQAVPDVIPYPPTIRQDGSNSITVEHVLLVNPYIGIQCGPDANELHYLKHVYISPLSVGFYMDMTTDIGRMEHLFISPKYYEEFTLDRGEGSWQEAQAFRAYMQEHATGVFMARSDWEYGYGLSIEGCREGLAITSVRDIGPNTQLANLRIHNCGIGLHVIRANPYGIALSGASITADMPGLCAAVLGDKEFTTVLQCSRVHLGGTYPNLVVQQGAGQMSFMDCTFDHAGDAYAVRQEAGGLSLIHCRFLAEQKHVELLDGIGGAQIIGSGHEKYGLDVSMTDLAMKETLINGIGFSAASMPDALHPPYPYPTEPDALRLYVVLEYGAKGDGRQDDTEAFIRALEAAGKTGGIVYVPAGWYKLTRGLAVPEGVELKGVFEVPCHTMGGGSVLQAYYGKGSEDGEPLVALGPKSGMKGIVIHHPEQNPEDPSPYPWAVQARGRRCYIINTVFVNAWLGLDLGTYACADHYVSYVSGAPIRCGISAGNNDGEGWIENVQYNPHYWYRCGLPNRPKGDTWHAFWHNQIKHLDALRFGYNAMEHVLNTFVFAARNGLYFYTEDGRGTNGVFIGHGTDGGEKGMRIDGIGQADFINTELVTIESPNRRVYIHVTGTAPGSFRMFNTLLWGAPHAAVVVEDGEAQLNQTNFVDHGECAATVEGGRLELNGSYFYHTRNHVKSAAGSLQVCAGMTAKTDGRRKEAVHILQKDGELAVRMNWSK